MTTERAPILYGDPKNATINNRECRLRAVEHIEQAEGSASHEYAMWHAQMAQAYALLALSDTVNVEGTVTR